MPLLIRRFTEADRAPLRELFVLARNATFTWEAPSQHRALDFDESTDEERILVALIDDVYVGFASIWEPDSFLHNLFVHPGYLRRGVGQALLARCAKHFDERPKLKCLKANANALSFYAAQGWVVLSEERCPEGAYFVLAGPETPASSQKPEAGPR